MYGYSTHVIYNHYFAKANSYFQIYFEDPPKSHGGPSITHVKEMKTMGSRCNFRNSLALIQNIIRVLNHVTQILRIIQNLWILHNVR